ncbi:MAG TPA: GNAT family N-acetyltransferase [Phenylobacterium sp.]
MQQPLIRRAGSADAADLARIGASTFTETFGHLYPPQDLALFLEAHHTEAAARSVLEDPSQAIWLAHVDGEAAGYALAGPCTLPHPDVTPACRELKRLYVAQGRQGAGLGESLMAQAMAWMTAGRPPALWIGVWSENFGAQRFYGRHGFIQVGEYEFPVGASRDREFILKRRLEDGIST